MRPTFSFLFVFASAAWLASCKHPVAPDKAKPDATADVPGGMDADLFSDETRQAEAPKKTVWNLQGYRKVTETPRAPQPIPLPDMSADPAMQDATLDAHGQPMPGEPMPGTNPAEPLPTGGANGPREPDAGLAPGGMPPAAGTKPADPLNDIGLFPKQE